MDSSRPLGWPPLLVVGLAAGALAVAAVEDSKTLFDGSSPKGWMLCDGKPLPAKFVQQDGLNPHDTGSYIMVYDEKLGDFVLDFDYKLTKGCNSGVFIRVGDLKDPVYTGLEIALDDTTGNGDARPGGVLRPGRPQDQRPEAGR